MSLYDIIDEISERQAVKTETGDTRVSGVMVGLVASNYDDQMKGRLCVTIPTRDEKANQLKWARLAMPSSGSGWGHYFMPEVGDQVLLAFEGGNIERPYVIGCVPKDANGFLTGSVDQHNQKKRIVTKHGSTILFEDSNQDQNGLKDKITIQTADGRHTVLLDNENSKIKINDKKSKNYIEMSTVEGKGALTVKVESKLTVQVGDSITITLDGEMGTVKIKAQETRTEVSKQHSVKSDGMLKIEGAQVTEKASSMYKVESGGVVNISGNPIKIG